MLLWQSHNTVVCGKHQNIAAEVNYQYCANNKINIARRLTGGGTVFHDEGNVCFTFIQNHSGKIENTIDYKRFLDPVKDFFNELNVPVHYSPRHDLMIDNKKISGNAQHVFFKEKRILHHGTLLHSSNLEKLGVAIKPIEGITHRGVNSVRSQVANINEYTQLWPSPNTMMADLGHYFEGLGYQSATLNSTDTSEIEKQRDEKFISPEWIWDYSPKHKVNRIFEFDQKSYELSLDIKNGQIALAQILSEGKAIQTSLCTSLQGPWRFNRIHTLLQTSHFAPMAHDLAYLFF
jgi:lipoate-protein ligase A